MNLLSEGNYPRWGAGPATYRGTKGPCSLHPPSQVPCHRAAASLADLCYAQGAQGSWEWRATYLRSRHGELEPVCTSRSLSSLSAELPSTGVSTVR